MTIEEGVAALRDALGAQIVALPEEFGDRRVEDWSGIGGARPRALLRPRSTEEVSRALAICSRHGLPVVTQGGLTGLVGSANALGGEVALSLERMNRIVEIDAVSGTMTVEAGAVLQSVQDAAAAAGFYFPLDLGARGSCTIGGNLATNAGGNRVIKYGMMRDQTLGLEAVLASGEVVGGLDKMIKNNSGYDLRHLLIGSEGTLAVITRAVLRLRPRPTAVATAWCGLPDFAAVTTLLARAQAGLAAGVSAFEVMWAGYHDAVLANLPNLRAPLAGAHPFYVLLESVGTDPARHEEGFVEFLGAMLEEGVVADAAIASSEAHARDFWAIRDAPGEYPRFIPDHAAYDVSFSIAQVGEAAQRLEAGLRALARRAGDDLRASRRRQHPCRGGRAGHGQASPRGDRRDRLRHHRRVRRLDLGRARHRHQEARVPGAVPARDRYRRDARHQAGARPAQPAQSRQDLLAGEPDGMNGFDHARRHAATDANAQDADLWRWFSLLVDERRIRWCQAGGQWLVSVDHRHVATEESFDRAVREARLAAGREPRRRRAA